MEKSGRANTLLNFKPNGLIERRICSLQSITNGSCTPMEFRVDQPGIGVPQIRIRKIRIEPVKNLHTPAQLIRFEKRVVAFPLQDKAL
jgi:hypothetical protein